ncbi:MAG TPA: phosphatase PAP2 family protein [Acidimicrobiia bacterium]|nr:phosphatase PAP2 family protein [Acidimicrobiia bacterium]
MPGSLLSRQAVAELVTRVHAFDEAVEKRLEPLRNAALDRLFYGLSSAADHGLIWGAIGGVRALRVRDPRALLRLVTALSLESGFTNGLVKSLFRRVRPLVHYQDTTPLPYGMRRPITSSFPSGHATTAFMAATLLADGTDAAPAYFTLAGLIAFSRVYVRLHHTSDVAAGALLGLALGRLARRRLPLHQEVERRTRR